jgi:hypothetical protein
MKKKSSHKKKKNQKELQDITKEVGVFDDFLIIEKKDDKKEITIEKKKENILKNNDSGKEEVKKDDLNDLSFLKDWILLENPFSNKNMKKPKESRFLNFFKKIEEEEDTKKKNSEIKEEIAEDEKLKKSDSLNLNSSINLSSNLSTNYDFKLGISSSDSSLENNSNQNIENNKIIIQTGKIEEVNLNLDINRVISLEDKRCTIMIKNIPNKFNRDLLLSIINQNFKGTYDLFILPTDINKYKNFGYSFINFTSSYYIPYFYFMFNGKMWSNTNSQKVCELTYSKVQGKQDLLHHYPIKIIFYNEEAYSVTPEQKYIIPNIYKLVFNKFFPNEKIEEYKYYFITKMPGQN